MTLETGSLLNNRYRIQSVLGLGGMGAVYQAKDESLGIVVAVKENLFSTEEHARQFHREAMILASLRHPNLPRVSDHFVLVGQGQYLVMDFIEGEDLRTRIDRGDLPGEKDAVEWGRQICDALAYLHSRKPPIIHRDIKPGNIRVTPEGRAMLVDFGVARSLEGQHTATGAKAMTPGFSPPEQYGVSRTDARSDIYSLAATMYIALTGEIAEDGLERMLGNKVLTPVRTRNPKVSPTAAAAIEKGLERLPEDRFQTIEEFRDALVGGVPHAVRIQPIRPPESPRVKLDPRKLAAAGVVGLLLLAVLIAGSVAIVNAIQAAGGSPSATAAFTVAPSGETASPKVDPTATAGKPVSTVSAPITGGRGGTDTLAFVSDRTGRPQIYILRFDGSDPVLLTNLPDGACQPDWSPDGARLVFISPCVNFRGTYDGTSLYIVNADGSDLHALDGSQKGDQEPAWSPDGRQIAFSSTVPGPKGIYLMGVDGKNRVRLSQTTAEESPRWAPDGRKLVFTSYLQASYGYIWSMLAVPNTENQLRERISRDSYQVFAPDWSPDGKSILYLYARDNGKMMMLSLADTYHPEALTKNGWRTTVARFSPDGQWVVFDRRGEGRSDLFILPVADSAAVEQITLDPATDTDPAWRPAGG